MKKEQIAAQLYTVREFTKNPSDVAATLKKIRKIGYRAVQISGLGPIDYRELAKILDGEGLTVCASHDGGDEVLDTPEKVVERLQILNCRYTAYPWPHTAPATAADYRKLARRLNRAAEVFASAGIVFCYHNHAAEFVKFKDGKLGLDIIYENTDPKKFMGEIDTYWVQFGGGDCVEWCRKLHKRLPLLHLKDYGIWKGAVSMMEIGYGNLNWSKIIPAAEKSGCKWFIVEEDVCRFDPFKSLKMSFDYLTKNHCES